ncbi:MAG TPA: universal stress protein [Bacteroidales bacterium]|mgnify:FL=1|nr:universal stress protein [Bacteroidales bacterium]
MKKLILTGIDFSDCSINALEHALTIAEKAEADLCMIWVNRPVSGKEIYTIDQDHIIAEVVKRFDSLMSRYQPRLKKGKLSYEIRKGKVYQEIVQAAEEMDAFLIVIGTHGASGVEEFWIGSNAFKIVGATERPIITIRGGVNVQRSISNIVMPIDSTIESRQKVPMTALISKYFDATIHVLALFSDPADEVHDTVREYVNQVEVYLKENEVKYLIKELEAANLTDATITYAEQVHANLISIMDEQEVTTSNLWLGPYAQQMVNHSAIPVMCIHAKDFTTAASM